MACVHEVDIAEGNKENFMAVKYCNEKTNSTAALLSTNSTTGLLTTNSTAGLLSTNSTAGLLTTNSTAGLLSTNSGAGLWAELSLGSHECLKTAQACRCNS